MNAQRFTCQAVGRCHIGGTNAREWLWAWGRGTGPGVAFAQFWIPPQGRTSSTTLRGTH